MAEVEYRDLVEWPGYRVGSDGSVWSCRGRWRILPEWHQLRPSAVHGHLRVTLHNSQAARDVYVHSIVLSAFVGPRPPGSQACHWNGVKTDNRPENLRWASARDNVQDSRRLGRHPQGERHGSAKLTVEQVRTIRETYQREKTSHAAIGRQFGVSAAVVGRIISGKRWAHTLGVR